MCVPESHSRVSPHFQGSIWSSLWNYWDRDLSSHLTSGILGFDFPSVKRSYMALFLIFQDFLSPGTIMNLKFIFLWFLPLNILFPWNTLLAFSFYWGLLGFLHVQVYYQNKPAKCVFSLICIFCFFFAYNISFVLNTNDFFTTSCDPTDTLN